MPVAQKRMTSRFRSIGKRLANVDAEMKSLYQTTYRTRIDNKQNMDTIVNTIDDNMDNILTKINSRSASDISNLYLKLQNINGSTIDHIQNSIEELFNDTNLMDSINLDHMSRSIQAEDANYDLILKYMPELEDALEIKKDNVLSSDNFTKDFINVISSRSGKDWIQQFNDRATTIKEKYKFQDLADEIYDDCSKYGEYFLYHVPYKKALERLLKRKEQMGTTRGLFGDHTRYEQAVVFESSYVKEGKEGFDNLDSRFISEGLSDDASVKLYFDHSNMLTSVVEYVQMREEIKSRSSSLTEEYITESGKNTGNRKSLTLIAPDGFVQAANKKDSRTEIKEIAGSVIQKIPRDQIFPICLGDDTELGYLYLEVKNDYVDGIVSSGGTYNSLINRSNSLDGEMWDQQNDLLIGQIVGQMADAIDAQFINANVELKNEIYNILRYNDAFCATHGLNNITVTFLPLEDVQHIYFKKDKKTHRGISDLKRSLVPAMLYCLLYLSDIIGKISRSQDKRIYYVNQNVETNVAKTMHNVLIQLKQGNMGMRQLQNMGTMFNIIGKYNDHIIPVGPSGDPPVRFEVMNGQNVETPTDLMDRVKESAIASTDVPLEFVQSTNQVDFATRFTMSNSKFLRKVFKRQRILQDHLSITFRKLYNYEYGENEQDIKILLPAPAYLNMSNSQQLIESAKNHAQAIADIIFTDTDDEDLKPIFINLYVKKNLGTYIDFDMVENLMLESKHIFKYNASLKAEVDNDSSTSDDDGYDDY